MDKKECRYCEARRGLRLTRYEVWRCKDKQACAIRRDALRLERAGYGSPDAQECHHCGERGGLELSRYNILRCTDRQACASRPKARRPQKFDEPQGWTPFLARFEPEMHARLKAAAQRETELGHGYGAGGVSVNDLIINAVADLLDRMETAWKKQEQPSG